MSRYLAFTVAFEALALLKVSPTIRRLSSAKGVIFTLHRVLPDPPRAFSPNAILQITPDFLENAIVAARKKGFEIVDLDTARERIANPEPTTPFVVLTFDDAYRDNLEHALPILRKHKAPFTLYVPTAFVDGVGDVWWQALEDIIAANDRIKMPNGAQGRHREIITNQQKFDAFGSLYGQYRTMPEPQRVAALRSLAESHELDLQAHCRSLIMGWSELRSFADEPLCTIGAHTVEHYELAKLPSDQAKDEMLQSADRLEAEFGVRPRHLSYPIGAPVSAGVREFAIAKELGFETAVTTRPGGLYHEHADHMTALPRISLNGSFQKKRYLDVFLTGAVFSMMNGNRRVSIG